MVRPCDLLRGRQRALRDRRQLDDPESVVVQFVLPVNNVADLLRGAKAANVAVLIAALPRLPHPDRLTLVKRP